MSYDQILEYCKESTKTESQLLEIDDINATIVKVKVLVILLKMELPQATSFSMLGHLASMV